MDVWTSINVHGPASELLVAVDESRRGDAIAPRRRTVTTKFLLPCNCGEKTAVGIAQAGQGVICRCGAELTVPTMKVLRSLNRVETGPQKRRSTSMWDNPQRILLIGVVITAAAAAMTGYVYWTRPRLFPMEVFSPWDTWLIWQQLRDGVKRPSFEPNPYLDQLKVHRYRWYASLTLVGVGLATMASSFFVPRRRRRRVAREPAPGAPESVGKT